MKHLAAPEVPVAGLCEEDGTRMLLELDAQGMSLERKKMGE